MSGLPGGIDGLHRRPASRWGPGLLAIGAVATALGVFFTVTGITGAVEAASGIREDAVATGFVGGSIAIEGADDKQTVYLDLDGVVSESNRDAIVSDTSCEVTSEGFRDRFDGSRQGVSTTIGDLSSVGTFTLPRGFGRLQCIGNDRPLVVSPQGGGAVFVAVLEIIGGVVLAGLGIAGGVVGWLRRRRARPAAPPPAGLPR